MKMKRKVTLLMIGILSVSLLIGCSAKPESIEVESPGDTIIANDVIKEKDEDIQKLQEKVEELTLSVDSLENLNKDYEKFVESTLKHIEEKDLIQLAKDQFIYTLQVNEKSVPKDGLMEISEGPIQITIKSDMASGIAYPDEIYSLGSLSGQYSVEHLDFMGQKEDSLDVLDGTLVQTFIYTFGKEKPIENFEFKISEELMERLGLNTTRIKIVVKR